MRRHRRVQLARRRALRRRRPPGAEQLCRTITRPLANERVQTNAAGQVVPKLKTPWRDGTTLLVMLPLEFMQRLAARMIYERPLVAGAKATAAPDALARRAGAVLHKFGRAARVGGAARVRAGAQVAQPAECEAICAHHRPVRLSWARLLMRVLDLDLAHCPNCGGELKIIAAILEQPVIEKILTHLGLQARAPPRSTARGQALQAA